MVCGPDYITLTHVCRQASMDWGGIINLMCWGVVIANYLIPAVLIRVIILAKALISDVLADKDGRIIQTYCLRSN